MKTKEDKICELIHEREVLQDKEKQIAKRKQVVSLEILDVLIEMRALECFDVNYNKVKRYFNI